MGSGQRYLGIDLGTSATRAVIIDDGGFVVASASVAHQTRRATAGVAEQDPSEWASGLRSALARLGDELSSVSGTGLCGQTPTVVLVSDTGKTIGPALTWQDTRAFAEAQELAEKFGDPAPLIGTGLPWSPANMPAKLLWLSRHRPLEISTVRWVLQPKDLLGLELTGNPVSDPWSSKGLCRVTDGSPVAELLEACGWSPEVCPATAPAWQARGAVTHEASERFGLPAGSPVSVGWSDALSQMLAAGSFERSSAFMFSGTSSIVGSPVGKEGVSASGLFNVPPTCAPCEVLYGPTETGGSTVEWAARLLGCQPAEVPALAATASGPLPLFVPYLSGERAPLWDQDVRALFLGVSERHGRAEIARAVLVGVFLSARHVLSLVEEATAEHISEVEVVGRGVGDPTWEAIGLNAMDLTLRFHADAEMSARGAAMLGAAAAGVEVEEASRRLVDSTRRVEPDRTGLGSSRALLDAYRRAGDISIAWKQMQTLLGNN